MRPIASGCNSSSSLTPTFWTFQFKVCPREQCVSTPGFSTNLFTSRSPSDVLISDFFGSVRTVDTSDHLSTLKAQKPTPLRWVSCPVNDTQRCRLSFNVTYTKSILSLVYAKQLVVWDRVKVLRGLFLAFVFLTWNTALGCTVQKQWLLIFSRHLSFAHLGLKVSTADSCQSIK